MMLHYDPVGRHEGFEAGIGKIALDKLRPGALSSLTGADGERWGPGAALIANHRSASGFH